MTDADTVTLDLSEQRSVGEILRATLRLYRRYPLLFLTLALGVVAPFDLALLAATGKGPLSARFDFGTSVLIGLLGTGLVTSLVSALHIHAVAQAGEGARPHLGSVALRGTRVLPTVVAATVAADLGEHLGFLLLFIPGIILSLRWSVVSQAAAIENEGWLAALRRSRDLTRDSYAHVFALFVAVWVILIAPAIVAAAVVPGDDTTAATVAAGIAINTFSTSFAALTTALLYYDLRARHRGRRRSPDRDYQRPRDLD